MFGGDLLEAVVEPLDVEDNYFWQFDDGMPLFCPCAGLFAAVACVFICDFALDEMVPQALVKALLVV